MLIVFVFLLLLFLFFLFFFFFFFFQAEDGIRDLYVTGVQTCALPISADQDTVDEPGGWRRTILSPVVPGVNFEWIRTILPPGCDAGEFPAYAPGSHEFVVVEAGTLCLTVGDRAVDLRAGDSLYFAADSTHGYANRGPVPCVYYVAALIMRSRTARLA